MKSASTKPRGPWSARSPGSAEVKLDAMKKSRLNFILLVGEDAGRALGCYGDSDASTPNLDRLAAEGCRYDYAFSTAPVCSPSRCTLVSGMYPWAMGTHHHRSHLLQPPRLLTHELREAGYYVNWANKTDFNFPPPADFADETREWVEDLEQGVLPEQPFFLFHNFTVTHESTMWGPSEKGGRHEERAAKAHLLRPGQRVDPRRVRVPCYLPDTPEIRTNLARFYEAQAIADAEIGRVLRALDASPCRDNTVVIYLTDHGRGLPREKRWCYGAGLHVSLVIRAPGLTVPGSVGTDLVSWVDIAPTILSLAGIPIPHHYQGQVFLGPEAAPARSCVFAGRDRMDESYDHVRVARNKRYHYIRNTFPGIPYSQRNQYMERMETTQVLRRLAEEGSLRGAEAVWMSESKPDEELYDAERDPDMVENLAANPELDGEKAALSMALDQHLSTVRDWGDIPERELITRGLVADSLEEMYGWCDLLPPGQRIGIERTIVEMPGPNASGSRYAHGKR